MIAEAVMRFKENINTIPKNSKYQDNHIWKNKTEGNRLLKEHKEMNKLNNYAQWVRANEALMENMETKKPQKMERVDIG